MNLLLPSFSVCVPWSCDSGTLYGPRRKGFVSSKCSLLVSFCLSLCKASRVRGRRNLSDQPSSSQFKKQQNWPENALLFLGALSGNANAAGLEAELDGCSGGL